MKQSIKWWGTGLLALSLLGGVTACAPQEGKNSASAPVHNETKENSKSPEQKEVVKIGHLPSSGHALYFIAQEEGFFEKEGLKAELHAFTNSGEGINAVLSGKLDSGSFGTAAPLTFLDKDADLTMYAGTMGTGAALVAKPEHADRFKDLHTLKGKKIGTVRLATGDAVLRGALAQQGLNLEKDVKIIEFDSPKAVIEGVKKGSLDAGVVWTPFIQLATKQGLAITSYSNELFPDHPCCRVIAKSENIKTNPEKYVKIVKALIQAEKFKQENKEKTVADVAKYINVDKDTLEKDLYGGYQVSSADPNQDGVFKFAEQMQTVGYIKDATKVHDHFTTDIYATALAELQKEYPQDPFYKQAQQTFTAANHEHH
ncbi:ABC transporter substrate-binding protein [Aneurinibacillus sp. UBA3580]|uniref:ABC transporter substrate-binding protein n=1 Tax=Aneurinibacillus sp. UBA3580 TaxID=1946041 RepID=UPI00257C4ABC|nr:ABC transporter substrate-binding protein [Aneurinibacillus sp. UBA3580]